MRIAVSIKKGILCALKRWRKGGRAIRTKVCGEGRGKEGKVRNRFERRREVDGQGFFSSSSVLLVFVRFIVSFFLFHRGLSSINLLVVRTDCTSYYLYN